MVTDRNNNKGENVHARGASKDMDSYLQRIKDMPVPGAQKITMLYCLGFSKQQVRKMAHTYCGREVNSHFGYLTSYMSHSDKYGKAVKEIQRALNALSGFPIKRRTWDDRPDEDLTEMHQSDVEIGESSIGQMQNEDLSKGEFSPKESMDLKYLYDYYEYQGYFFPKEILTRYFLSLKTKPFVILTGISGTGKTKIAQVFAEYMCQGLNPEEMAKRIAFVSVRPDWMDNKGLLGYYNLLDEKYHARPALRLLLEAEEHSDKPYFLILDEMNLAKVEQYFSDFLSIMESRTTKNKLGETLDLHSKSNAETQDGRFIPQWFRIPPNVYFTGTVNVDESTYMFSPKVLDRANVIEFNIVDLENYERGFIPADKFILKEENQDVRQKLLPDDKTPFCSRDDYLRTGSVERIYLSEILEILRHYNLHFGYRVINEISRFICNAKAMVQNFDIKEAFDIQILQKILPKFHGTQAKLEKPLWELLGYCRGKGGIPDESYLEQAAAYDKDASFPRSAQKLAHMIRNLKGQGYTSFIE